MASETRIDLSNQQVESFALSPSTPDLVTKTSSLLQQNHDHNHIFWSSKGFHNHIVHHLLSLYGLGSSPEDIQMQYNRHTKRELSPFDPLIVEHMQQPELFKTYLNQGEHYNNFLEFFRQQIKTKGYPAVIEHHLLNGSEEANDLLARAFAGFLHPIIHLGFGIEFDQPAIIAEALAQAASHDSYLLPFLVGAEKAAQNSRAEPPAKMVDLIHNIGKDEKVSTAAHWDDPNKLRDGILKRAREGMISYASLWTVNEADLERRTAEMINAVVYYTAAAQHPPKSIKFDFYFMHCLNCSIFFPIFLKQSWMSTKHKVRLLEWKGRIDLAMYASRRAPRLYPEEIANYKPLHPSSGSSKSQWHEIFQRVSKDPEDGHASKFIRTLARGEEVCRDFQGREEFVVKGKMWLKIAHMVIDSVESQEKRWVRSAGFDEAWVDVESRK